MDALAGMLRARLARSERGREPSCCLTQAVGDRVSGGVRTGEGGDAENHDE